MHSCAQIFPSKLLILKGIFSEKFQVASFIFYFLSHFLHPICREDELFCSHSAASPLSLVTAGFGVEVTNSLHELEVENNIIKLTGYISGPCNTIDMKVIYISNAKRQSISSHCNFGVDFLSHPLTFGVLLYFLCRPYSISVSMWQYMFRYCNCNNSTKWMCWGLEKNQISKTFVCWL